MITIVLVVALFALSFFAGLPPSLFWPIQIVGNFLTLILLANLFVALFSVVTIRHRPAAKVFTLAGATFFLWYLGGRIPDVVNPPSEVRWTAQEEGLPVEEPIAVSLLVVDIRNSDAFPGDFLREPPGAPDLVFIRGAPPGALPFAPWKVVGPAGTDGSSDRGEITLLTKWGVSATVTDLGPDLPPAFVAMIAPRIGSGGDRSSDGIWFAALLTEPDRDNGSVYRNRLIARRVAMQFRHDSSPALVVAGLRGNALSPRVRDLMRAGYLSRVTPRGIWGALDPSALVRDDLSVFQRGFDTTEILRERARWGSATRCAFTTFQERGAGR